ncbi:response regulator [Trinickia dabaoshanensis]|uniref:Response regulator n=1 Tax=Trinickia dabaoshanensis TaxID=564714 RepID=A0A2N7VKD2_9BURK|nr:response regulator [Trinickia dabaoshanensis]PMS17610.1 response regulator [Trinickia dabaoshanensis]
MSTGRTVSIVDDDEAVRLAVASLVRSMGWEADLFASAEQLLASPHLGDTTCLISDVRMPGMSGTVLHDRLVQLGYAIPTVFVTAFPTPELCAKVGTDGILAVIEKPVDAQAMAYWLNAALNRP